MNSSIMSPIIVTSSGVIAPSEAILATLLRMLVNDLMYLLTSLNVGISTRFSLITSSRSPIFDMYFLTEFKFHPLTVSLETSSGYLSIR